MALEILHDGRVRSVVWQDLCELSTWDVVKELLISLPWLILSLAFAYHEWYLPAMGASFMFFLCGLRQVHNAFHYAIGISRQAHEYFMFLLSIVMLGSMHAVQFNHLRHHRFCMNDEDVEAVSARMVWWRAILFGPEFTYLLHKTALEKGGVRIRRWVIAELVANAVWITLVLLVWDVAVLQYHVIVMLVANCLTAFFAVWTVHHDCDRTHYIARTVREKIKAIITYNMFYHVEHHLYPKVPTCRLRILAERLDKVAPELQKMRVF
ncbi:MAG TPA: fatty acid desaturase [Gammaproteobacteria bacterium]|nr:fatty acid desaturase [Gammaproteobacteria bacterium]